MMNEVKRPKKPLIFYYVIAMVILLAINLFTVPWLAQRQVKEVDYGTFLQMAEDKDLGLVEVQETENQIVFTNKDEVLNVIEKAILLFREQGLTGERFADTVERIGFENVQEQLLSDGLLQRKEDNLKLDVKGGATC